VVDGGLRGVDAAMDAASDLSFGKQGEEPLTRKRSLVAVSSLGK